MQVHPYFPRDAAIDYVPNSLHFVTLLAVFGSGCAAVLGATYVITRRTRPDLPISEISSVLWFALSGGLHLLFESYFVCNFKSLAGQKHLFAQLWKEYALSDSRYLTQDPFVLCIEMISVMFWGPLSALTAYMILRSHPMRYGLQLIVALAHLYGVVIYYSTSLTELYMLGTSHSRPESLYFWVYFVGFNAPWLVVPVLLIYVALAEIDRVFRDQQSQRDQLTGKKRQ